MKEYLKKLNVPEKALTYIGAFSVTLGMALAVIRIPEASAATQVLGVIALELAGGLGLLQPYINTFKRNLM